MTERYRIYLELLLSVTESVTASSITPQCSKTTQTTSWRAPPVLLAASPLEHSTPPLVTHSSSSIFFVASQFYQLLSSLCDPQKAHRISQQLLRILFFTPSFVKLTLPIAALNGILPCCYHKVNHGGCIIKRRW